jgi:hypothetical protein
MRKQLIGAIGVASLALLEHFRSARWSPQQNQLAKGLRPEDSAST